MMKPARRRAAPFATATLLGIAMGFAVPPALSRAESSCAAIGGEAVRVATVEQGLELRLGDGRLARLAGLDAAAQTPTDPDLAERARTAMRAMVVGKPIALIVLAASPDRWGRVAGRAVGASGDLATAAIADGLGRYRAEPLAHACRGDLLRAEATARRAALGLWNDPYYAVLGIGDHAAFAERAGTVVIAQGRLVAVLPGPFRTRLRFATGEGSPRGGGLSATILPRQMKAFEAQRVILSFLIGRTLRLRGLLDLRFGPHIELAGPDDLEVVAPDPAPGTRP